jgi:ATP-dependent exoDNAse (exonuclease V) alpha subunit
MAIYHLHVKVIGRKSGSSAVASAAYRSASRLRDDRLERSHDFSSKRGVVHSEVMLPEDAPEQWSDRERLWNDVEAFEVRKDAQLAREVEFALPREMTQAQGIELARDFVQAEFVNRGMIADLNVHWDMAEDGTPKPHAHIMLTMRSVDEDGFGPKVRDWNRTETVERWRERWAELANERLAELDIDARIDHRSFEAQGIALEPQSQIGAPAQRIEGEGIETADRAECTARSRATTARTSSPILPSHWMPSRTSNPPSRTATWRCSRIGTATEPSSLTQSWARCGTRLNWSNSARTDAARTASPPAR